MDASGHVVEIGDDEVAAVDLVGEGKGEGVEGV